MEIANDNASGFEDIYQIYDQFNDNPSTFITEQLIDPRDENKTNRTIIFDPNMEYLGINDLDEGRKNNIILLVFADNIDANDSNKGKHEQILDLINIYRTDTKSAAKEFEETLVEIRMAKKDQKYIDVINELLEHCYNQNVLVPLNLNDTLNEIAEH